MHCIEMSIYIYSNLKSDKRLLFNLTRHMDVGMDRFDAHLVGREGGKQNTFLQKLDFLGFNTELESNLAEEWEQNLLWPPIWLTWK